MGFRTFIFRMFLWYRSARRNLVHWFISSAGGGCKNEMRVKKRKGSPAILKNALQTFAWSFACVDNLAGRRVVVHMGFICPSGRPTLNCWINSFTHELRSSHLSEQGRFLHWIRWLISASISMIVGGSSWSRANFFVFGSFFSVLLLRILNATLAYIAIWHICLVSK